MPGAGGREPGAGAGAAGAVRPPAVPAGRVEGAGRSAPPARLAAESGISCLLFGLYVFSSHQEEFRLSSPPPRAAFLPPTPQDLRALETPRTELAPC